VRHAPETRAAKWKRKWHLYRGDVKLWTLALVAGAVLLACLRLFNWTARSFGNWVQRTSWWIGLGPSGQRLIAGTVLEAIGIWTLWGKLRPRQGRDFGGFWGFRLLVTGICCVIGGIVFLFKALGF